MDKGSSSAMITKSINFKRRSAIGCASYTKALHVSACRLITAKRPYLIANERTQLLRAKDLSTCCTTEAKESNATGCARIQKNIKVTQPPPDVYQAEREWCSYALLARQLSSDFLAPGHPLKPASCAWPPSLVQSKLGETYSTGA